MLEISADPIAFLLQENKGLEGTSGREGMDGLEMQLSWKEWDPGDALSFRWSFRWS